MKTGVQRDVSQPSPEDRYFTDRHHYHTFGYTKYTCFQAHERVREACVSVFGGITVERERGEDNAEVILVIASSMFVIVF